MKQQDAKLTWGIGAILLFAGSIPALLLWTLLDASILAPRRQAMVAASWKEVPCSISKIKIKEVGGKQSKGQVFSRAKPDYLPDVEFEYQWDGIKYTSSQFWFGMSAWKEKEELEKVLSPYQQGKEIICFVNPTNPSQAVLIKELFERSVPGSIGLTTFALVCVAIVGTIVGLLSFSSRKVANRNNTKANEQWDQRNSWPPNRRYVRNVWILSFVWNGVLGNMAYFTWVGGARMSFFIFFLGPFWLIGLLILAIAIFATIEWLFRKQNTL